MGRDADVGPRGTWEARKCVGLKWSSSINPTPHDRANWALAGPTPSGQLGCPQNRVGTSSSMEIGGGFLGFSEEGDYTGQKRQRIAQARSGQA